jgi:MFS family permease
MTASRGLISALFPATLPSAALVSMLCLAAFAFTLGLTYPLFSILLVAAGEEPFVVGINAAMTPLGIMISSPAIIWMVRRWGASAVSMSSALATPLLIGSMYAFDSVLWWMLARLLLGITINGVTTILETTMNQLLTKEIRGRFLGVYTTAFALSFAGGPLVLALTGVDGWMPFALAMATTALVVPGITACRACLATIDTTVSVPILRIVVVAPAIFAGVAVFALFDQAMISLLPVFGEHYQWTRADVVTVISAMLLGNAAFQLPIGWMSDHTSRRGMMTICASACATACFLLPVLGGSWIAALITFFVLGGIALGIFTVAIAELGDRFTGMDLLAGNAALSFMWGLGGFIGPSVAGISMELAGAPGLPVSVGLTFVVLAIISRLAP